MFMQMTFELGKKTVKNGQATQIFDVADSLRLLLYAL